MAASVSARSGWLGLGAFWAAVLLVLGAGAATLQVLGPPKAAVVQVDAAAPEVPRGEAKPPAAPAVKPGEIAAPVAALLEPSKAFPPAMLPRIAADGRVSRIVYARPFDAAEKRPVIAVLVTGLGMSDADSRAAIQTLPGPVSLAFSPYSPAPDALAQLCRTTGHEMLVSIPMEPQGFPLNDAGSRSLLTGAPAQQNATNLEWALSRMQGYVGATGALDSMRGERFADQGSSFRAVLGELTRRGLLYVDPRPGKSTDSVVDVPGRTVDLVIDDPSGRAEIEGKLAALERIAKEKGSAVGLAGPLRPVTVERIAAWARGLDQRGITLAPVSAVIGGK